MSPQKSSPKRYPLISLVNPAPMKPSPLVTVFGACAAIAMSTGSAAETYVLGPDSLPHPNVPAGTVTWADLPPGRYYPGTPHHYAYYRPAGTTGAKPLPYMVFLDGAGAVRGLHVPVVLDNLIAKGSLPPMAAIFVDPGVLPTVGPAAQHRYERIFEYDSTSDRYVRFLLDELIPAVNREVRLSDRADDHGIAGVSTGAVGALVAAWQRPDAFHRVLTLIGTFVDMKGSEELPSLIRKTEPRPLRILLQDGRNDHLVPGQPWGTFFAGSWPINNEVMYEAFQFAGYDAKLVIGDGGHDTKQGGAMMPEALRWLWAGYPAPVMARQPEALDHGTIDGRGRVFSMVDPSQGWELVPDGNLPPATEARTAQGDVYLIDRATRRILLRRPDGATKVALAAGEIRSPAALALSPDQAMLVVSDAQSRYAWSFAIASDGTLTAGEPYYRLYVPELAPGSGIGGVTFDELGQVYFASAMGIQVTEQNGRVAAVLNGPEFRAVDRVAFGGPGQAWLYADVGGRVFRRPARVHGVSADHPVVPPKPPL